MSIDEKIMHGLCGHVWDARTEDAEECPRCAQAAAALALTERLESAIRSYEHEEDWAAIDNALRDLRRVLA